MQAPEVPPPEWRIRGLDAKSVVLLVLLTTLNLLNFVDRYLLAGFGNDIVADLHLSYFQFSLLTGVVFSMFYAGSGVIVGVIADHLNRVRVIAAGVALWSVLTGVTGLCRSFAQMVAARTFISVGESALTPAALSILKDSLPPRFLSISTAVYYLGFPLGTGLSLVIAGALGPTLGWRGTFIALGGVGAALSALTLLFRDPAHAATAAPQHGRRSLSFGRSLARLYQTFREVPALRYLIIASVCMQFSLGGDSFEQLWLVRERGYTIQDAQLIFGTIYIGAATVALLAGGLLADWMRKRQPAGRVLALLVSTAFLLPMIAYRFATPGTALFYGLAVLSSMFASLTIGPYYSAIQELSPPDLRATVFAFVLLITALVGLALGSAAFGALSDWLVSLGVSRPLTVSLALSNAAGLISVPLVLRAMRNYERQAS